MSQIETLPPDGVGDLTRPTNELYAALVDAYEISQWNGMPGGLW